MIVLTIILMVTTIIGYVFVLRELKLVKESEERVRVETVEVEKIIDNTDVQSEETVKYIKAINTENNELKELIRVMNEEYNVTLTTKSQFIESLKGAIRLQNLMFEYVASNISIENDTVIWEMYVSTFDGYDYADIEGYFVKYNRKHGTKIALRFKNI